MKPQYAQTKAQRQAVWMSEFSDLVTTAAPALAGRMDWEMAKHFYFSGMTPSEAAQRYLDGKHDARTI